MLRCLTISLLAAAVEGGLVVEDDNASLLQVHQKSRAKSLEIPVANPQGVCENSVRLNLEGGPAVNTLGSQSDGIMKFENVLAPDVQGVDLIIENTTFYEPSVAGKNGLNGKFVQLNVWCGRESWFRMKLVDSDNQPYVADEFTVSVYDVDEGVLPSNDPQGRETIHACGVNPEVSEPNTLQVVHNEDTGCVDVSSTVWGNKDDNPTDYALDDVQAGRTVDFPFHNSDHGDLKFIVQPCQRGRNLLFAFYPAVSCYVADQSTTTTSTTTTTTTTTTMVEVPSSICYIQGDPHIKPFDRDSRDVSIYDSGDFWVINSEQVKIQGRYWATNPRGQSSMKSLAIGGAFMENRILIIDGPSGRVSYNGQLILTTTNSIHQDDLYLGQSSWSASRTVQTAKAKNYQADTIHLDLPLNVDITVNIMANGHIDAWIEAKPLSGGQDGHCGNFNGVSTDDTKEGIQGRDQTVAIADRLFADRGFQYAGCFAKDTTMEKAPGSDYSVNECATACANFAFFSRRTFGKCWCGDSHTQGAVRSGNQEDCNLCLTSSDQWDLKQDNERASDCLYQFDDTILAESVTLADCDDLQQAVADCDGCDHETDVDCYDCVFDACFA